MRGYLVTADARAGGVERTALDGRVPLVAGGDGSLHLAVNRLRRLRRPDQAAVGLRLGLAAAG
jgi:hypothetical protein